MRRDIIPSEQGVLRFLDISWNSKIIMYVLFTYAKSPQSPQIEQRPATPTNSASRPSHKRWNSFMELIRRSPEDKLAKKEDKTVQKVNKMSKAEVISDHICSFRIS